jgi:hypothetical protein
VQQIAALPLSPLTIPGVLTIGPQISLSACGALTVNAVGQLLAGATLDWSVISANIDLANIQGSSASGFEPHINPVFQVQGSISSTAEAYLLLSLEFGIDILNGAIQKSVAVVDTPDLSITATTSGQASLQGAKAIGTIGNANCPGVNVNVAFVNYVYADIPGMTQLNINTYNAPSFEKCLQIPQRRQISHGQTPRATRDVKRGEQTTVALNATIPVLNYTVMDSKDGKLELRWADNGNTYAVSSKAPPLPASTTRSSSPQSGKP